MDSWVLAMLFKPLAALLLLGGIALPIRWLINRHMKEGNLKNALLKHRWGPKDGFMR